MLRLWTGAAACLGWFALAVQMYLVLWSRWQEQASLLGGLVNFFGFFTVLSNILVATVFTYSAFGRESAARRFWLSPAVGGGVLASILFVAIAYSLLPARAVVLERLPDPAARHGHRRVTRHPARRRRCAAGGCGHRPGRE